MLAVEFPPDRNSFLLLFFVQFIYILIFGGILDGTGGNLRSTRPAVVSFLLSTLAYYFSINFFVVATTGRYLIQSHILVNSS